MDANKRFDLIKSVGEEILTEDDLKTLLKKKNMPVAYDGFEPSGTDIHIAQGLLRAININKMIKAGCKFKMLVADWHAWANNKLGGNLEDIQLAGKYYIEVWKACGLDVKNVEFIWVSDYIKDPEYWKLVMEIARTSTLKRVLRCSQIMGRKESDILSASQILYPCMQAADIFYLKSDITQLGLDQRKVNVLAREIAPKMGQIKPVVVSHHMLMGLTEPPSNVTDPVERAMALKMSKSNPSSAIFMTDDDKSIATKIKKAYCPAGVAKENPVLEYFKYIVFERFDEVKVNRSEKFGGDLTFNSYQELENEFSKSKLHPLDLKNTCSKYIQELIKPVREKILNGSAKLHDKVSKLKVTR